MAWDIEADSSHGDFPLAIKNYKKFAMELTDFYLDYINKSPNIDLLSQIFKYILTIGFNLKHNSNNLVMGDGDINSPIMLIGEAPNEKEDLEAKTFCGDVGVLLTKMLLAINIKKEKVYSAYSINFRPPNDRKPTAQEIKRYSIFLKEHISIIDPKILILMGTTAMEAVTGLNNQITNERGDWKEIIIGNKTIPVIITFNPSYLIRYPDKKKFSWEDLKKIRKKVEDLNIII